MKRFLLSALGLVAVGVAAPASAADLYKKAPPPPPAPVVPIYDWTGFYIGANGGWGQANASLTDAAMPLAALSVDRSAIVGNGVAAGSLVWKLRAIGRISVPRASA